MKGGQSTVKKRALHLLIICIVALTLTAVTVSMWMVLKNNNEKEEGESNSELEYGEEMKETEEIFKNLNMPFDQLAEYDWQTFILDQFYRNGNEEQPGVITSLHELNEKYPLERVQILDESRICTIHRLYRYRREEGKTTVFCYTIFELNGEDKDDFNNWKTKGERYQMTKAMEYKDFFEIKIGDSAEKVQKIETATRKASAGVFNNQGDANFSNYLLLKDGVLVIEYKQKNSSMSVMDLLYIESYYIYDMIFYPYGTETDDNITVLTGERLIFPN